jgi:hypothetical protein
MRAASRCWLDSSGAADENPSPLFRATGRDVNGGYAEYMTVPEKYAHPIPDVFSDRRADGKDNVGRRSIVGLSMSFDKDPEKSLI